MPSLLLQSRIWRCVWIIQICLWEKAQFGLNYCLKREKLVSKRLVYYITNIKSLFYKGICSSGENLDQNSSLTSKLNCHNLLETSTQAGD